MHAPISQVDSRLSFKQAKFPLPLTSGNSNSSEYCDCNCFVIVNIYADSYILASVVAIADLPVPVPASRIMYLYPFLIASFMSWIISNWPILGSENGKFSMISSSILGYLSLRYAAVPSSSLWSSTE